MELLIMKQLNKNGCIGNTCRHQLSPRQISEIFIVDHIAGTLRWRDLKPGRVGRPRKTGPIGSNSNGRLIVRMEKKLFKISNLIWSRFNGPIPPGMVVDHVNDDPMDNRLENLQLLTYKQNFYTNKRMVEC